MVGTAMLRGEMEMWNNNKIMKGLIIITTLCSNLSIYWSIFSLILQQNISLCVTEFLMHSGFGSIHYVPHNEVFHAYSVAKDNIFFLKILLINTCIFLYESLPIPFNHVSW